MEYYIDGSCKGNPGIGGWAIMVIKDNSLYDQVGSFVEPPVTNNMMEICALIHCLSYIISYYKDKNPIIYTDSMYNINCYKGCEKWLKKINLKNRPYVKAVSYLKDSIKTHHYNLKIKKVEGHAGIKWNEEADRLASNCAIKKSYSYYSKKIKSPKVIDLISDIKYDNGIFYKELLKYDYLSEN
ncbi:MAG: hypothetical protein IJ094_12970 [Bacilli bacterium]|nr:hypothetical protein [Bacilli bacterium]